MIKKQIGIRHAEKLLDDINHYYDDYNLEGWAETFYNCREQGYKLFLPRLNGNRGLTIWICGQRNSDVIWYVMG